VPHHRPDFWRRLKKEWQASRRETAAVHNILGGGGEIRQIATVSSAVRFSTDLI
jgi:hypothetical protein